MTTNERILGIKGGVRIGLASDDVQPRTVRILGMLVADAGGEPLAGEDIPEAIDVPNVIADGRKKALFLDLHS
jgi:hypothetical protein